MGKYQGHQDRLKSVRLNLQKAMPTARIFERHVGKFCYIRLFEMIWKWIMSGCTGGKTGLKQLFNANTVSINIPGMPDMWGIIPFEHGAIYFEIEIKTGTGKLNPDQIKWEKFAQKMNVWHITIYDETDYLTFFNEKLTQLKSARLT